MVREPGSTSDFTVIFDKEMEDQDFASIHRFVKGMTDTLSCVGLVAVIHDDDVLFLTLVENGVVVDRYDSSPGYFDSEVSHLPPKGGHAELICRHFRRPDSHHHLRQLLRANLIEGDMPGIVGEKARYSAIASTIGLPDFCAHVTYSSIAGEYLPKEFQRIQFESI